MITVARKRRRPLFVRFHILKITAILTQPINGLTITTFNMLAAVHRSMPNDLQNNRRESERIEWWKPRAEEIAHFIANEFITSDVVLLQEWWFNKEFAEIIDRYTGDVFERVAERRPGEGRRQRDDGMAVLIKKNGRLKLIRSEKVLTGRQRIAQIVRCEEKASSSHASQGRPVFLANVHLSFPSHPSNETNQRRQSSEVLLVTRALSKASREISPSISQLHILGGDFNSDSRAMAATRLEAPNHRFVNCANAVAARALTSGSGGEVNIGVTHLTHRGENVSVDHIFAKLVSPVQSCGVALRQLGYLDNGKSQVLDCQKSDLMLKGDKIISDHRPVTATFYWPFDADEEKGIMKLSNDRSLLGFIDTPLDPLESPWGY